MAETAKRFFPPGAANLTISFSDNTSYAVAFEEIEEIEFNDVRDDAIRSSGKIALKIVGYREARQLPTHLHKWERDGFGPTSHEGGITHYGLRCECGATACGNVFPRDAHADGQLTSIVHNVREADACEQP